ACPALPPPAGARRATDHDHQDHSRTSTPTADNQRGYAKEGDLMSINARCGSCNRELLLGQLVQSSDGFRCPFCGFAFAPGYATVAPGVAARVMAAQAVLVTALAELGSMTGDRLRLDRATVVDPVASPLPQAKHTAPARPRHGTPGAPAPARRPPPPATPRDRPSMSRRSAAPVRAVARTFDGCPGSSWPDRWWAA